MPRAFHLLAAALLLLAPACGDEPEPTKPEEPQLVGSPDGDADETAMGLAPIAPEPVPVPAVADTLKDFHARMEQLVAACTSGDEAKAEADARDLLLTDPAAWFAATYGAEHKRLAVLSEEYGAQSEQLPTLPKAIQASFARGENALLTERFIDPEDELATGFQAVALRNMAKPMALYSLRLMKADADGGWHLWSFAHVDGQFRFVGQMLGLAPEAVDPILRQLGSLRLKDAREVREEWAKKKK